MNHASGTVTPLDPELIQVGDAIGHSGRSGASWFRVRCGRCLLDRMFGGSDDPDAAGAVLDDSQFPVDPAVVQLGFSRASRRTSADVAAYGESEQTILEILERGGRRDFSGIPGILWRSPDGEIHRNPARPLMRDIDQPCPPGTWCWPTGSPTPTCAWPTSCSAAAAPSRAVSAPPARPASSTGAARPPGPNLSTSSARTASRGSRSSMTTSFVNKPRVGDICDHITGLGLQWSALSRVDTIDVPLLAKMAASGCIEVKYGMKSGSEDLLKASHRTGHRQLRPLRASDPARRHLVVGSISGRHHHRAAGMRPSPRRGRHTLERRSLPDVRQPCRRKRRQRGDHGSAVPRPRGHRPEGLLPDPQPLPRRPAAVTSVQPDRGGAPHCHHRRHGGWHLVMGYAYRQRPRRADPGPGPAAGPAPGQGPRRRTDRDAAARVRGRRRPGSGGSSPPPPAALGRAARPGCAGSPRAVLPCQLFHQPTDLGWNRRPSRHIRTRPFLLNQTPVPGQQGAGGHDPVPPQTPGQEPSQRGDYRPVSPVRPGTRDLTPQDCDLMPQHEDLSILGCVTRRPGRCSSGTRFGPRRARRSSPRCRRRRPPGRSPCRTPRCPTWWRGTASYRRRPPGPRRWRAG